MCDSKPKRSINDKNTTFNESTYIDKNEYLIRSSGMI